MKIYFARDKMNTIWARKSQSHTELYTYTELHDADFYASRHFRLHNGFMKLMHKDLI